MADRAKLVTQALTLQQNLVDLTNKTQVVKDDNQRLRDEKQILLAYLNSKK